MAAMGVNSAKIKYHDQFHVDLRERVRRWRERNKEKTAQRIALRGQKRMLNRRPPKARWALYDVLDKRTGNVVSALVRRSIEQPKPNYVRSRWMPVAVADYECAKVIITLRRRQLAEWQSHEDYVI